MKENPRKKKKRKKQGRKTLYVPVCVCVVPPSVTRHSQLHGGRKQCITCDLRRSTALLVWNMTLDPAQLISLLSVCCKPRWKAETRLPAVNHSLSRATAGCVLRAERFLSPNTRRHTGGKQHRPNTHLLTALNVYFVCVRLRVCLHACVWVFTCMCACLNACVRVYMHDCVCVLHSVAWIKTTLRSAESRPE